MMGILDQADERMALEAASNQPASSIPNLFLIGSRGTGKTTVAQILARRLGWSWIDADGVLEERHGRSIRLIFEQEGEAGFREKEAAVLEELCRGRQQVIATGGGVVLRAANRERLRASGRVVWLTANARILWERLQTDATTRERRPPLAGGGLTEIEHLLEVRTPLYQACADFSVDTTGQTPETVAQQVLQLLMPSKVRQ
jgi:shikimate kinase